MVEMKKDMSIEEQIKIILFKRMKKINKQYVLYKNNPYLPENVHQLRVNMRKIRALLNFFKPLVAREEYEKLNNYFRELSNQLGPIREIDVLIDYFNTVAKKEPQLINNYADIFRFLEKERLQLIKYVSTKKAFEEFENILIEAEIALSELKFDLIHTEKNNLEEFVDKRLKQKINKLKTLYKEIDYESYKNIHDVRKQSKKVRYTTVALKKWLSKKDYKNVSKRTEEIQNKLGKLTDGYINNERIKDYKKKTGKEELNKSFEKMLS